MPVQTVTIRYHVFISFGGGGARPSVGAAYIVVFTEITRTTSWPIGTRMIVCTPIRVQSESLISIGLCHEAPEWCITAIRACLVRCPSVWQSRGGRGTETARGVGGGCCVHSRVRALRGRGTAGSLPVPRPGPGRRYSVTLPAQSSAETTRTRTRARPVVP